MTKKPKKYGCKICKKPALLGWPDWICYDCKYGDGAKQTRLHQFGEEE